MAGVPAGLSSAPSRRIENTNEFAVSFLIVMVLNILRALRLE
jgi:hypothetical protein